MKWSRVLGLKFRAQGFRGVLSCVIELGGGVEEGRGGRVGLVGLKSSA